jgi:hypothetical protein
MTQADHNILYVVYFLTPNELSTAREHLLQIDKSTKIRRSFTDEEFEVELCRIQNVYGFEIISGSELCQEGVPLEEQLRYRDMSLASSAMKVQRGRIEWSKLEPGT